MKRVTLLTKGATTITSWTEAFFTCDTESGTLRYIYAVPKANSEHRHGSRGGLDGLRALTPPLHPSF